MQDAPGDIRNRPPLGHWPHSTARYGSLPKKVMTQYLDHEAAVGFSRVWQVLLESNSHLFSRRGFNVTALLGITKEAMIHDGNGRQVPFE
eukprot:1433781-Amphidinium_carterae.1